MLNSALSCIWSKVLWIWSKKDYIETNIANFLQKRKTYEVGIGKNIGVFTRSAHQRFITGTYLSSINGEGPG